MESKPWLETITGTAIQERFPVGAASLPPSLGADQAKVSKILNGKLDEFSIERVTEYMQKLGYDIHISTTPAPKERAGCVVMDKRELAGV